MSPHLNLTHAEPSTTWVGWEPGSLGGWSLGGWEPGGVGAWGGGSLGGWEPGGAEPGGWGWEWWWVGLGRVVGGAGEGGSRVYNAL